MALLSQSDFNLFLYQPIHLWAKYHSFLEQPTKYQSYTLNQSLKDQGIEYINQILLPNFPNAKIQTNLNLKTDKTQARIDALITSTQFNQTAICAIKASTSKNKRYIEQLGFQVLNLDRNPERIFLILLNPRYTRLNDLNLEQLFFVTEVTTEVNNNLNQIKTKINQALEVIQLESPASLESCLNPQTCPCPHICHPNLPDYSIYDAAGLSTQAKKELKNQDILELTQIPKSYQTHQKLATQINLTKKESSIIDIPAIKKRLENLVYPIIFLDYEAYAFPMPLFPGYWPQSSVVFQYSIHILNSDNQVTNLNFLHTKSENPTPAIIESLKKDLPSEGSIVVWDQGLESQVHQHLARLQTQDMLFLLGLNQRLFDLQEIFKEGLYQDYKFKGSLSLKKILPALVPETNHLELEISSGLEAASAWYDLVFDSDSIRQSAQIKKALEAYCQMDTLGCLKIYQKLLNL